MTSPKAGLTLAASLALITILGPAGIDMYLASMPVMADEFNTSYTKVQLTLTVFLLAMGAGQLVFGPIIDAYGRRRPLVAGIVVFILTSVWAAGAQSIDMLLLARFCQGMASALTLVVALSTVRDVSTGTQAAKLFALLMTIEGLAPVIAPAIGGYVGSFFGWRGVMLVLAGMGVVAVVNTLLCLPETLPADKRSSLRPAEIFRTYKRIAGDKSFLVPALALSAAFFFLFAYIAGASLVYQAHYGLSPDIFGLVFGGTGVAVLLGALSCSRLVVSFGVGRLAIIGVAMMTAGAAVGAVGAFAGAGMPVIVVGMFIAMFGLGIAESTLMTMAMSSQQTSIGSTAALLGAFQLVISSAATPLAGGLAEQGAQAWLGSLGIFGLVTLMLTLMGVRKATGLRSLAGH
ncbi:multidrug effflux MFS transporter [Massilia sp. BSC265]|uniref:multidrug effflux MFS transporter n=1 Tax=Massilia sp. BSC265 TaxID=1549812 RepID=UPI0004E88245|nr:multidrug effflux MFS transporter [Massilia sp. BSC265]KFI05664.1 multidrug ABC transporter [Massilia sp. BSC265]